MKSRMMECVFKVDQENILTQFKQRDRDKSRSSGDGSMVQILAAPLGICLIVCRSPLFALD